ncbi:DUF819 family protein [Acidaminobacter hydrogenoformans]|uniref:Uncharacterized membrane protein n=1 Tax=Acidaminobacter hydrogenoformans DSM 2784 TaxID=1120920 RepID=A0A1G5S2C3_9FIRM|nr:DUF819 family protein [Acidaminobacter hydrogenoformans]SCZ80287.1 Uncharacterized membrane protein [Acidaminobacter hydrogenoformans DSM 2784]
MNSFISADNSWALWSILVGIAALSIFLEQNYKWASKITGAIIGLVIAMVLANLNIIPTAAPTYDVVWGYVVPLAIPLLMFNANIKKIWRESGRLMIIFILSSAGTVVGVMVSHNLLKSYIPDLYKMSAIITGSYIGGGVNFAAMSEAFGAGESWISALTVADNLLMALYFFVLLAIPTMNFFLKKFKHPHIDSVNAMVDPAEGETLAKQYWGRKEISLRDIAFSLALGLIIVWLSTEAAAILKGIIPTGNFFLDLANGLLGNKYLLITTFTMLLATFAPDFMSGIHGAQEIGTFLIYIFLVVIGVPASISVIITQAPLLLLFTGIIVAINMLVSLALGKLFKFDLEEILLASNANIGGPTTAAAMAIAKGWNKLVGPIILAGVFGYIIGNYLGIFMGNLLQYM